MPYVATQCMQEVRMIQMIRNAVRSNSEPYAFMDFCGLFTGARIAECGNRFVDWGGTAKFPVRGYLQVYGVIQPLEVL